MKKGYIKPTIEYVEVELDKNIALFNAPSNIGDGYTEEGDIWEDIIG